MVSTNSERQWISESTWCGGTCTYGQYLYERGYYITTTINPDGSVTIVYGAPQTKNLGCQC